MLPEYLLLLLAVLTSGFLIIGIPVYKYVNAVIPKKRNNLVEAQQRLEQARLDAEAARLHKEAEKLYNKMYEEAIQDEDQKDQQEKFK